jgi:hypothetical protein
MISDLVTQKKVKVKVIEGDDLWQVGFSFDALYLVPWMSGLVKIMDIYCNEHGVFFIVTSLDKTGSLFISGILRGSPLESVKLPQQALYVSIPESEVAMRPQRLCRPVGD